MHMRIGKLLLVFLCVALWWTQSAFADAPTTLSVVDDAGLDTITVLYGDPVYVNIQVDDASEIAGASFTVNFDEGLDLVSDNPITSDFFETFFQQGLTSSESEFVTVPGDSKEYYSPLVDNPQTSSVLIAAARIDNGSGTNVSIFTLNFTADPGVYSVSISQTELTNTDAGYCQTTCPEPIPYLVGINGTTYPSYNSIATVGGTVEVLSFGDSDGDNIDDNWEELYFPGDTGTLTASGDYDGDGYSDYQEYLNRNELDPAGAVYDPTVANEPNGTGYDPPNDTIVPIPAINMLLLGN